MPLIIPDSHRGEAEKAHGENEWIWLYEIEAQVDALSPPVVFRLTSAQEDFVWPASKVPQQTWYPYAIAHSQFERDSEGGLPQVQLTVSNATRLMMDLMHQTDGFVGRKVKIWLLQRASRDEGTSTEEHSMSWQFQIASSSANAEAATFRLELPNFFLRKSPQQRFQAERCGFVFGGNKCGYIISAAAAYTTCGKSVEDCIARGQDHAARNLPVLHPARFGAFPGVPIQRGA